jgi:glutamyl-tRNA synthetase
MIVTRFAPSPTGFLHIGGVRSALYPYLWAKKNKGKFILRYEDTDRKRLVEAGYDMILKGLRTFGIEPDETMKQSDRLSIYKEYAEKLIASGHAYYCFATAEEIDVLRKVSEAAKTPFRFRSPYRDLPIAEAQKRIASGEKYTIRQKLPANRVIEFTDVVQGKMTFNTNDTDEGVLLKSDGYPTYHLAYIIDDFLTDVTDVFRGVEWLPSIPKHVLIYEGLNIRMPRMHHLPLILDPEGGKLSKRKGAVAVHDFINQGYLPEALLNFVALLGWTPEVERIFGEKERELFTMDEMLELFDPKDINKSSPVFNREKLLWFNQKYFQIFSVDEIQNRFINWLKSTGYDDPVLVNGIVEKGPDYLNKILEIERTRVKLLSEIPDSIRFYYIHKGGFNFKSVKQTKDFDEKEISAVFSEFNEEIEKKAENLQNWSHEEWEAYVRGLADKMKLKAGAVFMLLRLGVSDAPFSPPLYEIMQILGKKEVIARLSSYV